MPFAKPIVAGVDGTPESAWAASVAWELAARAGVTCHLVHGTREASDLPLFTAPETLPDDLDRLLTQSERERIERALTGNVPPPALTHLEVRMGNPTWVLLQAVRLHDADLLVLGGKRHAAVIRWFGGSTVHHAVRIIDVPLLVTATEHPKTRRVLVALDRSYAAEPTLRMAMDIAALFRAQLRIVHAVEPAPVFDELGIVPDLDAYVGAARTGLEAIVGDVLGESDIAQLVKIGRPANVIAEEVASWDADLVVVGSHGKGWVDRVLIGSTTEHLLNRLPASVLVVPVRAPSLLNPLEPARGEREARAPVGG